MSTYNKNIVKEIASEKEVQKNLDFLPGFWELDNHIDILIERLEKAEHFEEAWKGFEHTLRYISAKRYNDSMLKMFETAKIK